MIENYERNLLGAVLEDDSNWQHTTGVSSDDFSLDSHRRIHSAIAHLAESGLPADLITVTDLLQQRKQLDSVGGVAYLASLTQGTVTLASHLRHCAEHIRQAATRRRLLLTIRPDYSAGTFELTEALATTERREHEAHLAAVITAEPGINTRAILAKAKDSGLTKDDTLRLLRAGTGQVWRVDAPHRSRLYYPMECSSVPEQF